MICSCLLCLMGLRNNIDKHSHGKGVSNGKSKLLYEFHTTWTMKRRTKKNWIWNLSQSLTTTPIHMQYLLTYSYTQPFGTHIALSSPGWFGSGNTQPLDSDFHDVGANLLASKNENYQHVLLMLKCSGLEFKDLISCGKRNPKPRIGTVSSRYQGFVYTFWYGKRFFGPCLLALVEQVLRIAYNIHHWLGKLWPCFSFCCLFQFQFLECSATIQGACNSDC